MKGPLLTYRYRGTANLPKSEIDNASNSLSDYRKRLIKIAKGGYDAPESAINLPFDRSILEAIQECTNSLGSLETIRHVIVIGIGGSALGTEAIYRAYTESTSIPQLHVLDSVNSLAFDRVQKIVEQAVAPEEFAIVIVSKSGTTPETIVNAECVLAVFKKKFGDAAAKPRTFVASDLESPLMTVAEENEWGRVAIPHTVGGRFSVLSGAGLLPLALLGIDIEGFMKGAASMRDACLDEDPTKNPSLLSAAFIAHHEKNSAVINDHFFFTPELEGIGSWYRQLFAESLGKEKRDDKTVASRVGILPTVTIGSRDLHSVAQLYFGGPQNRVSTFVWCDGKDEGPEVPSTDKRMFADILPEAAGTKMSELRDAIREGTTAAYHDAGMPFTECELSELSPRSLGAFVMWKMIEVMYLAHLWGINAFDQPAVEAYKEHTREIFGKK